jgi:hypothetical protein
MSRLILPYRATGLMNGRVTKTERADPRGTKYTVKGLAVDEETSIGVVGRFIDTGRYLIITVYEVTDSEE